MLGRVAAIDSGLRGEVCRIPEAESARHAGEPGLARRAFSGIPYLIIRYGTPPGRIPHISLGMQYSMSPKPIAITTSSSQM